MRNMAARGYRPGDASTTKPIANREFTEDFDTSDEAQANYLRDLATIDLRDVMDSSTDDEPGADDEATASDVPVAGPSSKKPRTNKRKIKNRAPFIKNKPPKPGSADYASFVPEYFTMRELENQFSAVLEYVFEPASPIMPGR